jgi:DNA-binding beta-propeller fold protein YncE
MKLLAATLGLLLLGGPAGCQVRVAVRPSLPPLLAEGEVAVYLEPFPRDAERLGLTLAGAALLRADGEEVPLDLILPEVTGATARDQRLLARGRVPPGQYVGLAVRISRATLAGPDPTAERPADLLVSKEPVHVQAGFTLRRGRAVVLSVTLRERQALDPEQGLAAPFTAVALEPGSSQVRLSGYAVCPDQAALAMFDRRARRVTALIPTGRGPHGLVLDGAASRGYLALGGEDQVQVIDLSSGEPLDRINLRAGDDPGELALTPDGRLLVVLGHGSSSAIFVDPAASMVLDRLPLAEEPEALLLDAGGRRAYVLSRRTGTMTVLDLASRTVAATARTDAEPLRAQLNRAGTRLHVIHRGSAYMTTWSVPDLSVVSRTHVGLGAAALQVDPRTDLLYVGRSDQAVVEVYDPFALVPIDSIAVPGPVSRLVLDTHEGTLLAVVPSRGAVAVVDLASRRVRAVLEAGPGVDRVTLVGERN